MFRKKFAIIMALLVVLFINAFLITQMKFLNQDGNFVQKYILVSNSSFVHDGLVKLGLKDKVSHQEVKQFLDKAKSSETTTISTSTTPLPTVHLSSAASEETKKNAETVQKVWETTNGHLKVNHAVKPIVPGICNMSAIASRKAGTPETSSTSSSETMQNILVFFQLPAENFTDRADIRSELSAIQNVKVIFVTSDHQNRTIRNDIKFESKRFKDLLVVEHQHREAPVSSRKSPVALRFAAMEWTVNNCRHIDFVVFINYANKGDLDDLKRVVAEKGYSNMNFQCLLPSPSPSDKPESEMEKSAKSTLTDPMENMREEADQDLTKSFIICDDSTFIVSSNNALESYYNMLHKSI